VLAHGCSSQHVTSGREPASSSGLHVVVETFVMRPCAERSVAVFAVRTEEVLVVIPRKTTATPDLSASRVLRLEVLTFELVATHVQRMVPPTTPVVEVQVVRVKLRSSASERSAITSHSRTYPVFFSSLLNRFNFGLNPDLFLPHR